MRNRILLAPFVWLVAISTSSLGQQPQAIPGCPSNIILQALGDFKGIKAGMTRQELEQHHFSMAGGLLFREQTRYIYKDCDFIQLEVKFKADKSIQRDFSPKDTITDFSKLTLGYPIKD